MTLFVYLNTPNEWFRKKAIFARSGKVETISTFQRNQHFKKVTAKPLRMCKIQKKKRSARHSAHILSSVKLPLHSSLRSGLFKYLFVYNKQM